MLHLVSHPNFLYENLATGDRLNLRDRLQKTPSFRDFQIIRASPRSMSKETTSLRKIANHASLCLQEKLNRLEAGEEEAQKGSNRITIPHLVTNLKWINAEVDKHNAAVNKSLLWTILDLFLRIVTCGSYSLLYIGIDSTDIELLDNYFSKMGVEAPSRPTPHPLSDKEQLESVINVIRSAQEEDQEKKSITELTRLTLNVAKKRDNNLLYKFQTCIGDLEVNKRSRVLLTILEAITAEAKNVIDVEEAKVILIVAYRAFSQTLSFPSPNENCLRASFPYMKEATRILGALELKIGTEQLLALNTDRHYDFFMRSILSIVQTNSQHIQLSREFFTTGDGLPENLVVVECLKEKLDRDTTHLISQYNVFNFATFVGRVGIKLLNETTRCYEVELAWRYMELGSRYGFLRLSECNWTRLMDDKKYGEETDSVEERREKVLELMSKQVQPLSPYEHEYLRRCLETYPNLFLLSRFMEKIMQRPDFPDEFLAKSSDRRF